MPEWVPVKDVIEALGHDWSWAMNARCKYVELRIDTRDMHCLIKDRNGEVITLEQLKKQ